MVFSVGFCEFPGSWDKLIHTISAIPFIPLVVGGATLAFLVESVFFYLHAEGALAEHARVFGFEAGKLLREVLPDEVLGALGAGAGEDNLATHGG